MSRFFPPPTYQFEEDIFISYAHVDNLFLRGEKGWIDWIHEGLKIRLHQQLGEEPEIWRDRSELHGDDYFEEKLAIKLPKSVFFVSVLTPRYLKSESCLKELREFHRHAKQNGSISIDNKSRIFKVLKTPVQDDQYPAEYPEDLRRVLGYQFYEKHPLTKRVREYQPDLGQDSYAKFFETLDDLSWDITNRINHEKSLMSQPAVGQKAAANATEPAPPAAVSGLTVYLAETTPALSAEREKIKRALKMDGHEVLPDEELPAEASALAKAVNGFLGRAHLSIHMLGATYDACPDLSGCSPEQYQYELAAARPGGDNFNRLVWTPRALQVEEEGQQRFIRYAQQETSFRPGDEFLQTKLEDLKMEIEARLKALVQPAPPPAEQELIQLYVICDKQDFDAAVELQQRLLDYSTKLEVKLPPQEGKASEIAREHSDSLRDCHAVVIFCGKAREPWLRQKLRELQRTNGLARPAPLLAEDKAVYLFIDDDEPKAKQKLKEVFTTREAQVAKSRGEIALKPLEDFLTKLLVKGGAR
jgi:hypothetical protein